MKTAKKTFVIILLILISCSEFLHSQSLTASITIDTKNPLKDTTSKMIFGAFIEFLLDYVNGPNGMWAQEFLDRGFDIDKCEKTNIGCIWNDYVKFPFDSVQLMKGGYNPNGVFSKRLIGHSSDSKTGTYQTIVSTDTVSYTFYTYLKGTIENGKIILSVFDKDMKTELFTQDLGTPDSNWHKVKVNITPIKGHNRLNYLIYLDGKDDIEIDETSCVPNDNFMGIRKEYYQLLSEMNIGMLRYPGGWYADIPSNKLEYCIGDIDKRKSPNLKMGTEFQRMDMGLDEIARLSKALNCETQITINFASGTADEAANYVEYCNGLSDTPFGKLRTENGQLEPYDIKYWEVGNEQWGFPTEYAKRYLPFYHAMKAKDKSINIIIDGNCFDGLQDMDSLLSIVGDKCDFYSYHSAFSVNTDFGNSDYENYISMVGIADNFEDYVKSVDQKLKDMNLYPGVLQGSTEWSSYYSSVGKNDWLIDTNTFHSSLTMGLFNGNMINMFLRNPSTFKFSERTIGIGLIRRGYKSDGTRSIFGILPYQAIAMIGRHSGTKVFPTDVKVATYTPIRKEGVYWITDCPLLDVTATGTKDTLFLSVINRHPDKNINTYIDINHILMGNKLYELNSDSYSDVTTPDNPLDIIEKERKIKVTDFYSFPPHSLTVIAFYCPNLLNFDSTNTNSKILNIIYNTLVSKFELLFEESTKSPSELQVFDLTGRQIKKYSIPTQTKNYELSDFPFPKGLYIFKYSIDKLQDTKLVFW